MGGMQMGGMSPGMTPGQTPMGGPGQPGMRQGNSFAGGMGASPRQYGGGGSNYAPPRGGQQ